MEVKLKQVIFLNLCFRIFLLLCVLKENNVAVKKSATTQVLTPTLRPISKRVILIFINGLGADFLKMNITPFLQEKAEKEGASGIALVGPMQTNYWGMKAILTGRPNPSLPYLWMPRKNESIFDYVECKCAMGNLSENVAWKCNESEDNLIINFNKVMAQESNKTCLLVFASDLDPITLDDYPARLRQMDEEIQHFASLTDAYYNDGGTTYILTSARGTPIGNGLTVDVPVILWGKAIAADQEVEILEQTDVTALICALLGISYPSEMVGVVPMRLLKLSDRARFEIAAHTIRHYETVLRVVDFKKFMVDSSNLEKEQLVYRLDHILTNLQRANFRRDLINSTFVILLLSLWGIIFTTSAFAGHMSLFINLKQLFLLLLVVSAILAYVPDNWELMIAASVLLYWIFQNGRIIFTEYKGNFWLFFSVVASIFMGLIVGQFTGHDFALLFVFGPVVAWPVINGTYKRLNRFVVVSRLLSGFSVAVVQFSRIFGEKIDLLVIACISIVFVFNFCLLFSIFKRPIDFQVKIVSVLIFLTIIQLILINKYEKFFRNEFSIFLLAFSLLSACQTFGTILERLFKVYLSLLVPVLMFSVKDECIFYFAMVFHTFTWIFVEYHSDKLSELQYNPSVFSVEPKICTKSPHFARKDIRIIIFYVIYTYAAFFALGLRPELISYDLYVLPEFVYKYPKMMSYFLSGLKFFLPFFITTTSLIVFCGVREKPISPMIIISIWISDVVSCCFIFFSQFVNRALPFILRIDYSNFIILQCATICVLLSYFIGEHLLFRRERFLCCDVREKTQQEKVTS